MAGASCPFANSRNVRLAFRGAGRFPGLVAGFENMWWPDLRNFGVFVTVAKN